MFAGSNFLELSFTVNGSAFMYGQFINALIVFLLVILVLYYGVVRMGGKRVGVKQKAVTNCVIRTRTACSPTPS
jgi:large-conductance mechanosensitive channel